MRIALLHSFYSSETPSGENNVVLMQYEALVDAGHDVLLIRADTDSLSAKPGYKIQTALNVATGSGIDPTRELLRFQPDVTHIHNLFPNFATQWLKTWPGPVVSTIHNFRPMCAAATLFRDDSDCTLCPSLGQHHAVINRCYKDSRIATLPIAVRNRGGISKDPLLKASHRIIFLSERSKRRYSEFGLDVARTEIVANFVDDLDRNSDAHQGSVLPWLYVGRLTPEKGIGRLIDNWPRGIPLHIFGSGEEQKYIEDHVTDDIRYFGSVSQIEVRRAMNAAAGLVVPSLWSEGLPTVYLEALSAGLPILAKHGNSVADSVQLLGTGEVFDSFSEVPASLSRLTSKKQQIATAARLAYEVEFSRDSWVKRIHEVYRGAVELSGAQKEAY